MPLKEMNIVQVLQVGVIGLGFLLALLSYHLLTKEQKQDAPRPLILKSIYGFMFFSVALCILGLFSQNGGSSTREQAGAAQEETLAEKIPPRVLYNYFIYSDDKEAARLCNISEFVFFGKKTGTGQLAIEGTIAGKLLVEKGFIDFEHRVFGYKNQYYLKIVHDQGVAFLERNRGDYLGYWVGEVDDPDVNAVICPVVFSPDAKGLGIEEARNRWPILNQPCRPLYSLKEIL